MAAVPYAHIVAKQLTGKHPKGTHIDLAPNPKDIVRAALQFTSRDILKPSLGLGEHEQV